MINKEKWGEIIREFHERGIPDLIEREINIPKEVPLKRAVSIIGPRRSGKTYSMFQLIKNILKGTSIHQTIYINFERIDLEGVRSEDLINIVEVYYEIYPQNKNKKLWLFLDEIQNVNDWEKYVRTVLDAKDIQVFISGSSSKLLSKEIATSMRGRTLTYKILPFSFEDYLNVKRENIGKYPTSIEKAKILNKLKSYLEGGGYPEAIIYSKERDKILMDITETTIFRDVIERYKIRNIKLLKLLIKSLINSAAREFSIHKFYNFIRTTGIKASKTSLYNYVDALQDVFFIFPLRKFSYSYKEGEQSLPKIYVIDNGILTINGINENGRLIENFIFIELLRRGKEINYYKSADNKEVDFLIMDKKRVKQLIQVSFSLDDIKTKEREVKGLLSASKDLHCNNLMIITWNYEGEEKIKGKKIKFIPLWKWLLIKEA